MPEVSFQIKKKKKMSAGGRKEEIQTADKNQAPWPLTPAYVVATMVRNQCSEPQGSFQTPLDLVTSWVIKRHYSSVSLSGAECISIDR